MSIRFGNIEYNVDNHFFIVIRIEYDNDDEFQDIVKWLRSNFGQSGHNLCRGKRWRMTRYTGMHEKYFYLHFQNENDFIAFKLRWV